MRETVEVAPTTTYKDKRPFLAASVRAAVAHKDMHKRPFLAASVRAAVAYKDMHKHQQNTP